MLEAGVAGKYFFKMTVDEETEFYDVIVLPKPDLGNTINEQFHSAMAIIHECTHAGFDLLQLPSMTHLEHEAAAYVAGALYVAEKMLAMGGDPKKVNAAMQSLEKAAWDIALLEVADKNVPKQLYDALDLAIRAKPEYKDTADNIVVNDGVGKAWKLKRTAR